VSLKRILFLLPLLAVLMLSLALHAPARLLGGLLPPVLGAEAWGGSCLQGQLSGHYRGQAYYVSWVAAPEALLRGTLRASFSLQGPISAAVSAERRPGGWSAEMDEVTLTPAAASWFGAQMQTPAWQGRQLAVSRARDGIWHDAAGALRTAGGPLQLVLQGQTHAIVLPPARIVLSVRDERLHIDLQQADRKPLGAVILTADGRIEWQLRDRLLRLKAGYASQNDPDLIVLKVSEPL